MFRCSFCGKIFEADISHVASGRIISCKCQQNVARIQNGKNNRKDLKNVRFGKLVCLEPTNKRRNGCIY